MNFEITQKTPAQRAELNKFLGNVPILTEMQDADAEKAGQRFWFNGTLWTYAQEGQFGSLAEGTPWPVKGYKEFVARFKYSGGASFDYIIVNKSDGIGSPSVSGNLNDFTMTFPNSPWASDSEVNIIVGTAYDEPWDQVIPISFRSTENGIIQMITPPTEEEEYFEFHMRINVYPPTN